jgi:MFS superfamily sulfate permease-like transporter
VENVKINSACVFSNVLSLKKTIEKSTSSKLVIEFSPGTFVDISSQLMLKNLKNKMQQHNKEVTYVGLNFLNIEAGH